MIASNVDKKDLRVLQSKKKNLAGIAWVTGAGKGIGRHVTLGLARDGWRVAASSRTMADLEILVRDANKFSGAIYMYPADVTNANSITKTIKEIEIEVGPINLAIFNAGTYIRFGVANFTAREFAKQLDINVMGTVNCLAPIMELMKNRQSGHIAVMSSLSGYRGLPMASAYGASKAALTNMCEALKPELETYGVRLSVVHPGFVRTTLTDRNEFPMPFLMEPDLAARRIIRGISRGQFEISFPTRFSLILKFVRCLPYPLYFAITRRMVQK